MCMWLYFWVMNHPVSVILQGILQALLWLSVICSLNWLCPVIQLLYWGFFLSVQLSAAGLAPLFPIDNVSSFWVFHFCSSNPPPRQRVYAQLLEYYHVHRCFYFALVHEILTGYRIPDLKLFSLEFWRHYFSNLCYRWKGGTYLFLSSLFFELRNFARLGVCVCEKDKYFKWVFQSSDLHHQLKDILSPSLFAILIFPTLKVPLHKC